MLLVAAWLAAVPAISSAALPAAAPAVDVGGDDAEDRFVGTGGLILPSTFPDRTEVAQCPGCHWRLVSPCVDPDAGQAFSGTSPCASVTRGCGDGRELLRVLVQAPGGPWRDLGVLCVGEAGPVTVTRVETEVGLRLTRMLPPPEPSSQPRRGIVTQIPVVFAAGQPAAWADGLVVLALPVTVRATPRWSWRFGDGATLDTADPGGPYPHVAVSHVYRRAGQLRVVLDTRWRATFTVDGLGPFDVRDEVWQQAGLPLGVGEGRALLTVPPD